MTGYRCSKGAGELFRVHSTLMMAQRTGKFIVPPWASSSSAVSTYFTANQHIARSFSEAEKYMGRIGIGSVGDAMFVWGMYYYQTGAPINVDTPAMSGLVETIGKGNLWKLRKGGLVHDPVAIIKDTPIKELFAALRSGSLMWADIHGAYDTLMKVADNSVWFRKMVAPSFALAHRLFNRYAAKQTAGCGQ